MGWPGELSPGSGPAWPLRSWVHPLLVLGIWALKVGAAGPAASGGVPALAGGKLPRDRVLGHLGAPGPHRDQATRGVLGLEPTPSLE